MGSQVARNGQHGKMLGILLKHEIVVSCELLEGTQWSAAKGTAEHLRLLVQPRITCKLGPGELDEIPAGDPRSQFISGLW